VGRLGPGGAAGREHYRDLARRLGVALTRTVEALGTGDLTWASLNNPPEHISSRNFSVGVAGTVYALLELGAELGEARFLDAARKGVAWLLEAAPAYGQSLSDSALNGGTASVAGSFTWTDGSVKPTVADSNVTEYSVTFTPTDTANYNMTTTTETLIINKATPIITAAPTASSIIYGQSLSDSALSGGTVGISGSFSWTDGTIKPVVADSDKKEYSVTFTPSDTANNNTTKTTVKLTVNKAVPVYTTPKGLTTIYGQKLSEVALPSGFTWESDTTAFVGSAGIRNMTVTFTPADTANYITVT
jgi:predicted heme/steroid binding protein